MKKTLSILLCLAMLLMSCVAFSSCSGASAKDFEKAPAKAIGEALDNTTNGFFVDETNAKQIIEKALKAGAINISFESDDLMGDVSKISETIYMDSENYKTVLETLVTYEGTDRKALVLVDKDGIAMSSKDVLGSDRILGINYDKFVENFSASYMCKALDMSEEDAKELTEAIETLAQSFEKASEKDYDKETEKLVNELYLTLEQVVSTEKIEDTDCIVVTYTINNTTFKAFFDKYIALMRLEGEIADEMKKDFDESFNDFDEDYSLDLTAKIIIDKKSNAVSYVKLNGTVAEKVGEQEKVTVDASVHFSDSEIALVINAEGVDGEKIAAEGKITKTETDADISYNLTLKGGTGSVMYNFLDATYKYTKNTGAVLFSGVINLGEDEEKINFELAGSYTVDDNKVRYEINSFKVDELEIKNFKAIVEINAEAQMPTLGEAQDITELTESDVEAIAAEIEGGFLGQLISGMMNDEYYA